MHAPRELVGKPAEVPLHRAAADEQRPPRRGGRSERRHKHADAFLRHESAEKSHDRITRRPTQFVERSIPERRVGPEPLDIDAGRPEPAIATLTQLAQRTDLEIPVDGVLMQLGRAYDKAGKTADAIRAFTRIGDEFPDSPYAGDAKTEAERLKARTGAA